LSEKKILIWVFIIALAVRLAYVLFFAGTYLSPDSQEWIANARQLLAQHAYGNSWRPPLYSFFLAAIYFVCGESVLAVRILQAFLGAFTCLLVYFAGKTVFHQKVGLISGILAAFYPYFIYYSGDILAETLLIFLLSASVASLAWFQQQTDYRRAVLAGLCLGLTILCKPVILPFVFLLLCWILIILRRQWRRACWTALLTGLTVVLVMLPWTIRNYLYYHELILVSTSGATLWLSYNPLAERLERLPELLSTAEQNSRVLPNDFEYYPQQRYALINSLPRQVADQVFREEAWDFIKKNPRKVLWLWSKRLGHFWRLYPLVATPASRIAAAVSSSIVIIGGWAGIFISWRTWPKSRLLVLLIIVYTAAYSFFLTNIRYRVPLDTVMMIFAALAWWQLYKYCFNRQRITR
jgi:4-amino-4-deoxy-L-arabinose transferase-like glycosyltransferase